MDRRLRLKQPGLVKVQQVCPPSPGQVDLSLWTCYIVIIPSPLSFKLDGDEGNHYLAWIIFSVSCSMLPCLFYFTELLFCLLYLHQFRCPINRRSIFFRTLTQYKFRFDKLFAPPARPSWWYVKSKHWWPGCNKNPSLAISVFNLPWKTTVPISPDDDWRLWHL